MDLPKTISTMKPTLTRSCLVSRCHYYDLYSWFYAANFYINETKLNAQICSYRLPCSRISLLWNKPVLSVHRIWMSCYCMAKLTQYIWLLKPSIIGNIHHVKWYKKRLCFSKTIDIGKMHYESLLNDARISRLTYIDV